MALFKDHNMVSFLLSNINRLITHIIHEMIENKEEITSDIYNCLMDIGDYEEGEIIETGRHGWHLQKVIFHFRDKHYMGIVWKNDMCGDEWESQVLKEVKLKEVKVLKWVDEEELNGD